MDPNKGSESDTPGRECDERLLQQQCSFILPSTNSKCHQAVAPDENGKVTVLAYGRLSRSRKLSTKQP